MAKPCTPHPIAQRVQLFKPKTGNVGGSRGTPLAFLWGIQRGYSLRKENTPFGAAARTPHPQRALRARKYDFPYGEHYFLSSEARYVSLRNVAFKITLTTSAIGNASHTSSSRPVSESRYAAGSSTTIWRQTELMSA